MKQNYYKPAKLLTTNNHKTIKSENVFNGAKHYVTYILYMSPYNDNSKGINVCPFASRGCAASCLVGSGFGGMYTKVADGRRNKTEYYLSNRSEFLAQIDSEIAAATKKHSSGKHEAIITIRLNGTSDIAYEKLKVRDGKNIFELYPSIQFYDYTKNYKRFDKVLPANYHLTFSKSETNTDIALDILSKGFNVAMVFDTLPATYNGYTVIDGDKNDLRFLDEKNVIVGLKYKKMTGKGADNKSAFTSGFAISTKQQVAA
jgi:hypothetical protein